MQNKKTYIVATIGPASASAEIVSGMLESGLNIARFNFSHDFRKAHKERLDLFRRVSDKTGIRTLVLQDLSGPKFRLGDFYKDRVMLVAGHTITLTTEKIIGDERRVSVNYEALPKELTTGSVIMVDDGKKKFIVREVKGSEIVCDIAVGGETKGRRSLNLPGAKLSISSLTAKDKKDLQFGILEKADIIALSFVRRPEDIEELRGLLRQAGSPARICAKIETKEAVECFDAILHATDIVMVARGDLAVEIGLENVPSVQKDIIKKCNAAGKFVITATQMLESMIKHPTPTRAEVSDVANAIIDGTDAVMLSEESALGNYPVEAVAMLSRIALRIESDKVVYKKIPINFLFSPAAV